MWWISYSQTFFLKIKIGYISRSIVLKFYKLCFYCILIWGLLKLFYMVRAALVRGSLSYITCWYHVIKQSWKTKRSAIRRRLIYTDDNILEFWSEIICFHCLGPIGKGHNKLEVLLRWFGGVKALFSLD